MWIHANIREGQGQLGNARRRISESTNRLACMLDAATRGEGRFLREGNGVSRSLRRGTWTLGKERNHRPPFRKWLGVISAEGVLRYGGSQIQGRGD